MGLRILRKRPREIEAFPRIPVSTAHAPTRTRRCLRRQTMNWLQSGVRALVVLALLGTGAASAAVPSAKTLDARIPALMKREQVNGLAIAVIDGGQMYYLRAFGWRSVERRLPLTTDTIMYGASLSKAAFAYYVLKLVDAGRLDLDAPLAKWLPEPLPDYPEYSALDARWKLLTPRMLLNHSSGLGNFAQLEP